MLGPRLQGEARLMLQPHPPLRAQNALCIFPPLSWGGLLEKVDQEFGI
jgi:hypothetical protein